MERPRQFRIYATRDQLLDGDALLDDRKILQIAKENILQFFATEKKIDMPVLNRYVLDNISYRLDEGLEETALSDKKEIMKYLLGRVCDGLTEQEQRLGSPEMMENFMRVATLQAIDDAWVEEVDYLQQLQSAVAGRSSAQRKPVYEYQRDALESFQKMEKNILRNVIRNILLSNVYVDAEGRLRILLP